MAVPTLKIIKLIIFSHHISVITIFIRQTFWNFGVFDNGVNVYQISFKINLFVISFLNSALFLFQTSKASLEIWKTTWVYFSHFFFEIKSLDEKFSNSCLHLSPEIRFYMKEITPEEYSFHINFPLCQEKVACLIRSNDVISL